MILPPRYFLLLIQYPCPTLTTYPTKHHISSFVLFFLSTILLLLFCCFPSHPFQHYQSFLLHLLPSIHLYCSLQLLPSSLFIIPQHLLFIIFHLLTYPPSHPPYTHATSAHPHHPFSSPCSLLTTCIEGPP